MHTSMYIYIFIEVLRQHFHSAHCKSCYTTKAIEVPETISILHQQRDLVEGVRKLAIFADVLYYLL